MSLVEQRTIPILSPVLTGSTLSLSATDQEQLAAWAMLRSMVGEFDDRPTVAITQAQRTHMSLWAAAAGMKLALADIPLG
jgi:hypothetical protein